MIAHIAAAYWAAQDRRAAKVYARLMSERRANLWGEYGKAIPDDWKWEIRLAAERKALTYTKLRKWASRLERKRSR